MYIYVSFPLYMYIYIYIYIYMSFPLHIYVYELSRRLISEREVRKSQKSFFFKIFLKKTPCFPGVGSFRKGWSGPRQRGATYYPCNTCTSCNTCRYIYILPQKLPSRPPPLQHLQQLQLQHLQHLHLYTYYLKSPRVAHLPPRY